MDNKEPKIMNIEDRIFIIRGQKVMLDYDLADLYQVPVKRLNEQVGRNIERFPQDFMFQLTNEEFLRCQIGTANLRSQIATAKFSKRRFLPYAFTEYGVAMLSSVLNSRQAIQVNISIMRTFGRLRQILSTHKELANRLEHLEQKVGKHTGEIQEIFVAIHKLMNLAKKPIKKMGFINDK
jgi:hypothetical protein